MTTIHIQADDFYSALSHPMRLRAVVLIHQMNELCVCELTHALELPQPVISRHLAQLKEAGLLLARKQGLWVYYRINDALPGWAQSVLQTTTGGIAHTAPYQSDVATLHNDRSAQSSLLLNLQRKYNDYKSRHQWLRPYGQTGFTSRLG